MRKIFVFLMALVGLGMMLGGCVSPIGTTKIPAAPVIKNYINPLKPKKNQVVGNKNIKFYVGKVVDSRKIKRLATKRNGLIPIVQGKFTMKSEKDFIKITKTIINKALTDTGWGVVNSKTKADYIINVKIEKMAWEYWSNERIVDVKVYVVNHNNVTLLKKQLHNAVFYLFSGLVPGGINIAGKPFEDFYHALVKLFSSPEFVNAVEHRSVVFDNSTPSK